MYLLILLIPGASIAYLKVKNINIQAGFDGSNKWGNLLFSFQRMVLASWMFDIAIAYYTIDVAGVALELNPLGWPFGILSALVYYAPAMGVFVCFAV